VASDQPGQAGATPADPDPAAGATPGGQQQAAAGATPAAGGSKEGAKPDTSLGDKGREALDKERAARRDADRESAELRKRIAELEDAGKDENQRRASELERANERIRELQGQQQQRELLDLKREVADELHLPASLAQRLVGEDRRSLKADAQKLADELEAGKPVGDLGIGRGAGAAGGQSGRVSMNDLIREASGRN
jgi:hypothetical protein